MSSQPLFFFNKLLLQLLLPHSLNVWIKMRYRTRTLLGLCQDRITLNFQDFAPGIRLIHHFDQSHCWITANARHPKWGACGLHDFLRSRHVPISGREPSVKQHVPKTSKKKKTHGCTHIVYIFTLSHITKPHSSAVGTGSPNGMTYFLISFWQDPLGAQIGIALVADTNNPHSVPLRLAEAPGDGELNMKFLREKFAEFRAFRSPINQDVNCLLEVAVCCWNLRAPSCP